MGPILKTNPFATLSARRLWMLLLAGLLLVGSPLPGAARDVPRCELCRGEISGRYLIADGKPYCARCVDRHDQCPGCGKPLRGSRAEYRGQDVCTDCARRAGRCGHCGDILLGRFYDAPGHRGIDGFCEDCYRNHAHCAACGLPHRAMNQVDGQWVCDQCRLQAERCGSCGAPIVGKYYVIEFQPDHFCRKCYEERKHCDFCARPIANGGRSLHDGRQSCRLCAADAVRDPHEARRLFTETMTFLRDELHMEALEPFDLVLVDNDQMAFLNGRKARRHANLEPGHRILRELGLFGSQFTPESPRPAIAILSDLPRKAFYETAAHEFAHYWHYQANPELRDPEIVEGFAQWVAAQWLREKGFRAALAKLESRSDPHYGTGYRRFLEMSYRMSQAEILGFVRHYGQGSAGAAATPLPRPAERAPRPLSEILSPRYLRGDFVFLRDALPIDPARVP